MPYKDPEKRRQYHREYMREWSERNPLSEKQRQRQREYTRERYKRNPEYMKEYREENRKKITQYERERVKKNRGRINMLKREWYKRTRNDPRYRLNDSMASAIYDALKKNKAGRKWETLVGYTLQDLIQRLETQFDENMNWGNYGSYFVIDHIKPRSLFSFMIAEDQEFKECWALSNLQPLEKIANIKKSNHYPLKVAGIK